MLSKVTAWCENSWFFGFMALFLHFSLLFDTGFGVSKVVWKEKLCCSQRNLSAFWNPVVYLSTSCDTELQSNRAVPFHLPTNQGTATSLSGVSLLFHHP